MIDPDKQNPTPRRVGALVLLLSLLTLGITAAAQDRTVDATAYFLPTECPGENSVWDAEHKSDGDIRIVAEPNLRVMFHGNRFVAAGELIAAFQAAYPLARVSYTAIPPIHTLNILGRKPAQIAALDAFGMPDVVMLPANTQLMGTKGEQLYSKVQGMVLVARADDGRVDNVDAPITRSDLKIVFQGMQNTYLHATYTVPRGYYGANVFDAWTRSSRADFSELTHHRSVPARILLGCADIGFQFKQSQVFLEQAKQGRFKFYDIPAAASSFENEHSFLYVLDPGNEIARDFAEFMLKTEAQSILAKYSLQK